MNTVIMTGNLTRDPELKYADSGVARATMRIANNDHKSKSCYIEVIAFGRTAENVRQYLRKGRKVGVTGKLEFQEWGSGKNRQSRHVLVASAVEFMDKPTADEDPSPADKFVEDELAFDWPA